MADSKSTKKKTTKSAGAQKSAQAKKPQPAARKPIRREVWAIVCLLFAVIALLGCGIGALMKKAFAQKPETPAGPDENETETTTDDCAGKE